MPKSITENKSIKNFIEDIIGKEAIELIKIWEKQKKPLKDEFFAKKMKLKVTEVRAILNKLHFRGIATYIKKRKKDCGWYDFTWEIKPQRIAELLIEKYEEELMRLKKQLQFSEDYAMFSCKKRCQQIPFEIAAEYNFVCPSCGGSLDPVDRNKEKKRIEKEIERLRKEINALEKIDK